MEILFKKTHKDAVVPSRAYDTDIGLDLTAIEVYRHISETTTLYDTGISVVPPPGYYIEIVPRSSISKSGYMLSNSIGIIDPTFNASIKVPLTKIDLKQPNLECPFKIVQMVLRKAHYAEMKEISEIPETERGSGGFGSTDSKTN